MKKIKFRIFTALIFALISSNIYANISELPKLPEKYETMEDINILTEWVETMEFNLLSSFTIEERRDYEEGLVKNKTIYLSNDIIDNENYYDEVVVNDDMVVVNDEMVVVNYEVNDNIYQFTNFYNDLPYQNNELETNTCSLLSSEVIKRRMSKSRKVLSDGSQMEEITFKLNINEMVDNIFSTVLEEGIEVTFKEDEIKSIPIDFIDKSIDYYLIIQSDNNSASSVETIFDNTNIENQNTGILTGPIDCNLSSHKNPCILFNPTQYNRIFVRNSENKEGKISLKLIPFHKVVTPFTQESYV